MYISTFIRRNIRQLPLDKIFTTRDFLPCGTRAAIDQALFRLVNKGIIIRLARGVFVKAGSNLKAIDARKVAGVKARAFGKRLASWGGQLAQQFGLVAKSSNRVMFAVDGSSSCFRFGDITIHFKKVGPRKLQLGESKAGQALQALWHIGCRQVNQKQIIRATADCLRPDRQEIHRRLSWVPAWLSEHFWDGKWRPISVCS